MALFFLTSRISSSGTFIFSNKKIQVSTKEFGCVHRIEMELVLQGATNKSSSLCYSLHPSPKYLKQKIKRDFKEVNTFVKATPVNSRFPYKLTISRRTAFREFKSGCA
jgi:hypothetical protein